MLLVVYVEDVVLTEYDTGQLGKDVPAEVAATILRVSGL